MQLTCSRGHTLDLVIWPVHWCVVDLTVSDPFCVLFCFLSFMIISFKQRENSEETHPIFWEDRTEKKSVVRHQNTHLIVKCAANRSDAKHYSLCSCCFFLCCEALWAPLCMSISFSFSLFPLYFRFCDTRWTKFRESHATFWHFWRVPVCAASHICVFFYSWWKTVVGWQLPDAN